jgi:type I restriction enzyme S subunit
MAGESQITLGDLCSLITDGKHGDCADQARSGFYFLSVKDVVGNRLVYENARQITERDFLETHRRTNLEPGDVLFTNTGTIGRMAIAQEDPRTYRTTFQKSVAILKPKRDLIDPHFLYYLLHFDNAKLSDFAAGTTQKNLLLKDLRSFSVRVPPLPEQRAIVHILGTLDNKIELNRQLNETLEAAARALFTSWFVGFDPVRAKSEGRDPGLPKSLADLFPNSFDDSELGEIPKGWGLMPLPDLIEVNPQRTLRKGDLAPYLDMANMPTRGHSPATVIKRPFGSGMRFINGDTLVARITPCLENGKTTYVDFLEGGQVGWGSTEYIVLRPKPPLPTEFAYCLARSGEFRDFAIQSMTGSSGRQRVPPQSLSHFRVVAAPKPVAELFRRSVKPYFARASVAAKESRTLSALRDALLPRLISGELRVKDADRLVGRGPIA